LLRDVIEMRQRVSKAHPAPLPWDCKHRRGALVDLEFMAQYLALEQAPANAAVLMVPTTAVFEALVAAGRLDRRSGAALIRALGFWHHVQQMLRITLGKIESETVAADLIDRALARATGLGEPAQQRRRLARAASLVMIHFERLLETPAAALTSAATTLETIKS
jgi:[glutamine synthetase] adenylyltransferase / [glutamine synthetase]-adenylyl-L-tyrosine phosphorylase